MTRRDWALLALTLLATTAAYHAVCGLGFVYDDLALVRTNPSIRSFANVGDWFARSFWSEVYNPADAGRIPYYRPVVTATLAFGYALSGLEPWGYHAIGLTLHLANVALVYALGRRFYGSGGAVVAALGFGLLPVHTENVAWVSGVSDVVATVFGLTGSLLLLRAAECSPYARVEAAAGFFSITLSFFAKESALLLPVGVLMVDLLTRARDSRRNLWPWLAIPIAGAVYFACRVAVFGAGAGFDLVQTELALPAWRLASLRFELLASYVEGLVNPFSLNAFRVLRVDLEPSSPEIRRAWWTVAGLAALLVTLGAASQRWKGLRPPFAFVAFVLLLTLPQIARPQSLGHFVYADRYLYVPSVGFCWLLGYVFGILFKRSRAAAVLAAIPLLTAYGLRTEERVPVWRDEFTFFTQSAADSPDCATVQCALGRIHLDRYQREGRRADLDRARSHFAATIDKELREHVFVSNQDVLQAYLGLAGIHMIEGRPEAALSVYEQAIERYPDSEDAHMLAGIALAELGNTGRAEAEFLAALRLRPRFSQALYNLGNLHLNRGDYSIAVQNLREALDLDPESPEIRLALGTALYNVGRREEAAEVLRWIEAHLPDHPANVKIREFLESSKR